MRKGKQMGCGGAKKEKSAYITKSMKELFELPEWQPTMKLIEEAEKNPGMELDFD